MKERESERVMDLYNIMLVSHITLALFHRWLVTTVLHAKRVDFENMPKVLIL